MSAGQKTYVDAIRNNDIVFAIGPAGTGKTYLAVAMAVHSLTQGLVNRIILARPAVEAGERLGFLPGDIAAKFDPSGKHLWSHHYGEGVGGRNTSITGVATDSCSNVVLHGPFGGIVNFGADPLSASDTSKSYAFVATLNSGGAGILSKMLVGSNGGNADAFGLGAVAVDGTGGAIVAPNLPGGIGYQSTADFGGGPLTGVGKGSVAIASFDSSGKYRWAYAGGAPSTATASASAFPIGVATWGSSVIVTGSFNKCNTVCATAPPGTTLVLAGKTFTGVSGGDLFLASFTP